MNWVILAQIIAQEGIPVAEAIYNKWAAGQAPTTADFAELRALGQTRARELMSARLVAAGIPLDSPQAKALLALT